MHNLSNYVVARTTVDRQANAVEACNVAPAPFMQRGYRRKRRTYASCKLTPDIEAMLVIVWMKRKISYARLVLSVPSVTPSHRPTIQHSRAIF